MYKIYSTFLVVVAIMFGMMSMTHAAIITSYDIDDAVLSGFGNWAHFYNGTITNTGVTGSAKTFPWTAADYSGGSGTLNDGLIGNSHLNTQLFALTSPTLSPEITLYLDNNYLVDDMTLYSFVGGNSIPGNITHVDVTISGITETFATTTAVHPQHEYINIMLGSSGLSSIATNMIILDNWVTTGGWSEAFSISEIDMTARTSNQIPEPAIMLLLGSSLFGLAAFRRKIRR